MREPRRFATLRSSYQSERNAHMLIAGANKRLLRAGKQPTHELLGAEHRAAEAAKLARARLHAAIAVADKPYSAASDWGFKATAWRYKAAFDAYHAIVAAQAQQALAGDPPTLADLLREQEAREALAEAKRNLELFGPGGRPSSPR
jgi:hypothetical protein